jgi:hypothetical protein
MALRLDQPPSPPRTGRRRRKPRGRTSPNRPPETQSRRWDQSKPGRWRRKAGGGTSPNPAAGDAKRKGDQSVLTAQVGFVGLVDHVRAPLTMPAQQAEQAGAAFPDRVDGVVGLREGSVPDQRVQQTHDGCVLSD